MNQSTDKIKAIWICGFSSAGKTTLSRLLVKKLKENGYPSLLIDGNETRDLFENKYGFDPKSRRKQTVRIQKMTMWVLKQKILPVVAIIHPFEDDRLICRERIPGYYEVFLNCDLNECISRDEKNVYLPVIQGKKKHVVGLDIPYDPHTKANLELKSDRTDSEKLLEILWDDISNRLSDNRLYVSETMLLKN